MTPAAGSPTHKSGSDGLTLLTLSFAGDFPACRLLCETVDRFVAPEVPHWLVVPKGDLALFGMLANARRQVLPEEAMLPPWLHKLPMPGPQWRRRLHLPRRNLYVSWRVPTVRGWIAQQMMKLSAAAQAPTDVVLHIDSDAALVRPLGLADMTRGGRVRLLRRPGAGDTLMHRPWHRAAALLLGIEPVDYGGADYIDNLVTWRRPVVRALLERIEAVGGRSAAATLARTPAFSEYVLYGTFCDRVLGLDAARHYADPESLCETLWSAADGPAAGLAVTPGRFAIGIQSTIPISAAERRQFVDRAIAQAAGRASV